MAVYWDVNRRALSREMLSTDTVLLVVVVLRHWRRRCAEGCICARAVVIQQSYMQHVPWWQRCARFWAQATWAVGMRVMASKPGVGQDPFI